jgi:uncharacterized protein (TIGR03086 family)
VTESYEHAVDGFARRLALVTESRWAGPTPCADWSVRDLVAHVLDEQLWIPPLLSGETIAEVGHRFSGDQIGRDPAAAWADARGAAVTALAVPGVEQRVVQLSFGASTVADYVRHVSVDTVVHTWDLARAVGGDETLDPADVAAALTALAPMVEVFRTAGVFGPALPVVDDADEQTRLLALLGRAV